MKLNQNESNEVYNLLSWLHHHSKCSYALHFDNKIINAMYEGDGESDNNLSLADPKYEEYWALFFTNIETGEGFEVNYHTMPKEVYCDGKKVDLSTNYDNAIKMQEK